MVSMAMVVVLHGMRNSGALEYLSGVHYWVYWSLETACCCAVNLFVLLSGYFQVNAKFKTRNVVKVAITGIWIYSVVFSALQMILTEGPASKLEILEAVFPLLTKKFWFVNSYVLLYLISPYLNKVLHAVNRAQLTALVATLVIVISVRITIFPMTWTQTVDGGMGIIWFVTLYCVAAWLRLCDLQWLKAWMGVVLYLVATVAMLVGKRLLLQLGLGVYATKLYNYASIFALAQAVGLFVAFLKSKPVPVRYEKLIGLAGKHSYSVYIIHFAMWNVLYTTILGLDKCLANPFVGVVAMLTATVLIFVFCVFVDMAKCWVENKAGNYLLKTKAGNIYLRITEKFDNLVNG